MIYITIKGTPTTYDLEINGHANPVICRSISTARMLLWEVVIGDSEEDGISFLEKGTCYIPVDKTFRDGVFMLYVICELFDTMAEKYPSEVSFDFIEGEDDEYINDAARRHYTC